MPTPFMHMALAERLLVDPRLPTDIHDQLMAAWGAFLLGSIAPDARLSSGLERGNTHFFEYLPIIEPSATVKMLTTHPELSVNRLSTLDHVAFVAGYAAHLQMDQVWCTDFLYPALWDQQWKTPKDRYDALHILLTHMDTRDLFLLPTTHHQLLYGVTPQNWLPFLPDEAILAWREQVAHQLAPHATKLTASILGARIEMSAATMTAIVNDPNQMQTLIWDYVDRDQLASAEAAMYEAVVAIVIGFYRNTILLL